MNIEETYKTRAGTDNWFPPAAVKLFYNICG